MVNIDFDNNNLLKMLAEANDNMNNEDIITIRKLREQLKQYNIYDFLANVSALSLFPQNQNKGIIFQCAISTALSIPKEEIEFNNRMSYGKFKQIIQKFEAMKITRNIDPPEFPFVQRIMYYGNYELFMGTSVLSPENLQNLIRVITLNFNKLSNFEICEINYILNLLKISDEIFNKLHIDKNLLDIKSTLNDVFFPSYSEINLKKEMITFEQSFIIKMIGVSLFEELQCNLNCTNEIEILNYDEQHFYLRPFIINDISKMIILDITLFPNLLMNKLLKALHLNENIDIIEEYNKYEKHEINEYFSELGNQKINENCFDIELWQEPSYCERLYSTGNDGVIINISLFDTGENFDYNHFCTYGQYFISADKMSQRINYIFRKLKDNMINDNKIFLIIIPVSIGRSITYGISKKLPIQPVLFIPYELKAISINEKEKNLFLQRYIISRNRLYKYEKNLFSELNLVSQYVNNDYSFYINDDFDTKQGMLCFIGEFSYEYILRAEMKEDKHLVDSFEENSMVEVSKIDSYLYANYNTLINGKLNNLIEIGETLIWIITPNYIDINLISIYKNIIELISFLLIEVKDLFSGEKEKIVLEINVSGKYEEYLYSAKSKLNINEILKYNIENNIIKIYITPEVFKFLSSNDNEQEKEIIIYICDILGKISECIIIKDNVIEYAFANKYKQKTVILDISRYPYLKPFSSKKQFFISHSDENLILDDIGVYVHENLKYDYGPINNKEIVTVINKIVGQLYTNILTQLKKYDKNKLIRFLYNEYEQTLSNIMIRQRAYIGDCTCYPNHLKDINEKFNELNKVSVALKFLIELVSSLEKHDKQPLEQYELEYLTALASELINWAYINDLYKYEMINIPAKMLKSNRVGINHDVINKSGFSLSKAREEKMGLIKKNKDQYIEKISNSETADDYNKLFFDEFGYTLDDYSCFFNTLIEIGEKDKKEIHEIECSVLKEKLKNTINITNLDNLLKRNCLVERKDFLNPPSPYKNVDVYPWRFNRNLSFTRRPLIIVDNKIIWGNRAISNSMYYLLDLIEGGKLNANSETMVKYISEINIKKGKNFNDKVYNYVSSFSDFIVDKNVSKINKKRIVDEYNQQLGDIDVLCIVPEKGLIIALETKSFALSKNFYEIHNEYLNMFFDTETKKSFLTKHKKRIKWLENNLSDVIKYYSLKPKKWKIKYMFIVDEYMVSKDVYNIKEKICTLNSLTRDDLVKF